MNEWTQNALRSMMALMEELLGLYGEIGAGLALQQEALAVGDMDALDERTKHVDRLNALLRGVERKRKVLSEGLALRLSRPESELSVGALLELVPLHQKSRLRAIAKGLKQELRHVTASRELMGNLLERQTGFTRRRLDHLQVLRQRGHTYGANAQVNKDTQSKLIDRTV
jgi:hypothetical protein